MLRREPTLARGRSLFVFTVVYFALAVLSALWRDAAVPTRLWVAGAILLALTAALSPWWFVVGGPRSAVIATMEVCFGRVCANFDRITGDRGFVMAVPGGGLHITLRALPFGRATVVAFSARPRHKKGDLLRNLFRKQYRGLFPTITIRMR